MKRKVKKELVCKKCKKSFDASKYNDEFLQKGTTIQCPNGRCKAMCYVQDGKVVSGEYVYDPSLERIGPYD